MPTLLETRLAAYRRRVLARDEATLRALSSLWERAVVAPLEAEVAALARDLARDGLLSGGLTTEAARGRLVRLERYRVLLRQADEELARLLPAVERAVRAEQLALARFGSRSAEALVAASLGSRANIVAGFARLPVSALQDMVGLTQAGTPLRSALLRYGSAVADAITDGLVQGMAKGTNPNEVARLLRDRLVRLGGGTTGAGAPRLGYLQGLARTSMLASYRAAAIRSYAENADLVEGWRWVASHSPRTCGACLALSGRTFPLSVEFMRAHPACRCAAAPVLRDEDEPEVEAGAAWFARQDAATQDRVLGEDGGAAYRAGEVRLADFLTTGTDKTHGWIGEHYRADSLAGARGRAERRGGRQAA